MDYSIAGKITEPSDLNERTKLDRKNYFAPKRGNQRGGRFSLITIDLNISNIAHKIFRPTKRKRVYTTAKQ